MIDQAEKLRQIVENMRQKRLSKESEGPRVVTITSGKGGVGKTNFTANFAIALSEQGYRVVIIDADFGLANIDVILGIIPKYNLSHVINSEMTFKEVVTEGPCGIKFISGGAGVQELVHLSPQQLGHFVKKIPELDSIADIILIDTGAGLSESVLRFVLAANETILVITPEPTAITDAYALIKIVHAMNDGVKLHLVANKTDDIDEAKEIIDKFKKITKRFLGVDLQNLGYLFFDQSVSKSVKLQTPFILNYPRSVVSRQIRTIAEAFLSEHHFQEGGTQGMTTFVRKLLKIFRNKNEINGKDCL